MNVLMIDVGGSNVKLMASGYEGRRKFPSGPKLTATQMVKLVKENTQDWKYEAISLGFPGVVVDGKPLREPGNLGNGWLKMDYRKAFGKPVHVINDASMQALGSYEGGRMLFFGLGTSTGATLIVDDVIIPMEIGSLLLSDGKRFMERLGDAARKESGPKRWLKAVHEAIDILGDVFTPEDIVLGGGNAKKVDPLPRGCRRKDNQMAFQGAIRLWPGADMLAESYGSSLRIETSKSKAGTVKKG